MKSKHKKQSSKKNPRSKFSNTKLLFLSIALLFIVFEALFILRNQQETLQSNSMERKVAGVTIEK